MCDGGVQDTFLLGVKFLSLWSFQTGYPGPLPPLASIPLFNPAQVSQVRAFSCGGAAARG